MLQYLGEREASQRVESAVHAVYAKSTVRTGDLGGNATTAEFTRAVINAL